LESDGAVVHVLKDELTFGVEEVSHDLCRDVRIPDIIPGEDHEACPVMDSSIVKIH
jgi:hypothetical protein